MPEAQLAYDRLAEQRARAQAQAPVSQADAKATSAPVAISGQALLLSRPVLLVYAAAFLTVTFFLAHWIEDPALARRFGQQFADYRKQVPGWWPRWPRRTPGSGIRGNASASRNRD